METLWFYPDASAHGLRLDTYLAGEMTGISRSAIKKLIDAGAIRVNGCSARAGQKLKSGEAVLVELPDPEPPEINAENIALDVLYEDAHLIVVNKPKGMVVHPAPGHYSGTLVNALLYHCGESLSGINGILRPGIVHRIDKDTSGVLVAAKTDMAHKHLAAQLAEHNMHRIYHAIARFNIKLDSGVINAPIGRHATERKKMAVNTKTGKSAVTHYRVIARYTGYTYIEVRLETGRTHQIRVHMAHIGHPLLGDGIYGAQDKLLHGQTLHAKILGFLHPHTGAYVEFETDLPGYFKELI